MRTVTLTFDLATRLMFATHRLVMMITCVKLFLNPAMHNKLWVGNEQVPTFDLATRLLFATHRLVMMIICAKIIFKSHYASHVMGRKRTGSTEVYAQSLSSDCDLDHRPSDMVVIRDTLSCHDDYLC